MRRLGGSLPQASNLIIFTQAGKQRLCFASLFLSQFLPSFSVWGKAEASLVTPSSWLTIKTRRKKSRYLRFIQIGNERHSRLTKMHKAKQRNAYLGNSFPCHGWDFRMKALPLWPCRRRWDLHEWMATCTPREGSAEEEVEVSLLIALLFALRSGDRLRTEVTSKFKIEGFWRDVNRDKAFWST